MKHYAQRDLMTLGEYYTRHVDAMTREGLRAKTDIAAELAHRDMLIDKLAEALGGLLGYTGHDIGIKGRRYAIAADKALALVHGEPQPTKRFVSALERHTVWTSHQGSMGSGYRVDPSTYTLDGDKRVLSDELPADDTTPASE